MDHTATSTSLDVHMIPQPGLEVLQNSSSGYSVDQNAKIMTPKLESHLRHALEELNTGFDQSAELPPKFLHADSVYKKTMQNGLLGLLGLIYIPESQAWEDAMVYCRDVMSAPKTLRIAQMPNGTGRVQIFVPS